MVGCQRVSEEINKEVILTSFTVLADIVENIVGDEFIVKSITNLVRKYMVINQLQMI